MDNPLSDSYDVIVVGGGLGGLTAARRVSAAGHSVLLAEQHSQFGGLATTFKRRGYVFDVALHGFPIGMRRSFRKYWGREFADRVVQVKRIRFENPQFQLETTFDATDFTRLLTDRFGVEERTVGAFFECLRGMNYYDRTDESTGDLFQRFFPDRNDVWRLLMEPITYANGSTLDDPAITYGIVFGNFMSEGVYTFDGGTDTLMNMMVTSLRDAGVVCESQALVESILIEKGRVEGAVINGQPVRARAVVSNANLLRTVHELVGDDCFPLEFLAKVGTVRPSCSSAQVYIGIKPGESFDSPGDLVFHATNSRYDAEDILACPPVSRTFSVYAPSLRDNGLHTIVASMNARYDDWRRMAEQEYEYAKEALIENALAALESLVPGIRGKVAYAEAATPTTFERYTRHTLGASFGTKFEGLECSRSLASQVGGLFHVGSTGIIMSGWLGAANYGVIAANEVDKYLADSGC